MRNKHRISRNENPKTDSFLCHKTRKGLATPDPKTIQFCPFCGEKLETDESGGLDG